MTSAEPAPRKGLDGGMKAALAGTAVAAGVLSAGAFLAFDPKTGLGVAIGGAIALANLALFARIGRAFLERKGKTAPWTVITMLKLLVLFGGIWLILKSGWASPLALAVGYGALPLGITFGTLFGPRPDDGAPGEGGDVVDGPREEHPSGRSSPR